MKTSGIILAGGRSRRLGRAKAVEPFLSKTLLQQVFDCLMPVVDQAIIVTSPDSVTMSYPEGALVFTDIYPGRGPLSGIYTGLIKAENQYSIVVGCDMPFLSTKLLLHMVEQSRGYDAVVPRLSASTIEPLHAVYSRACLGVIKSRLDRGQLQTYKVFDEIKVRYLDEAECRKYDPEFHSLFNINDQQGLDKGLEIAKRLRSDKLC